MIQIIRHQAEDAPQAILWAALAALAAHQIERRHREGAHWDSTHAAGRRRQHPGLSPPLVPLPEMAAPAPARPQPRFIPQPYAGRYEHVLYRDIRPYSTPARSLRDLLQFGFESPARDPVWPIRKSWTDQLRDELAAGPPG